MGRKTKFTDKHRRKVLEATSLGCTREIVAKYAGISETTLYDWLSRGREAKSGQFADFFEAFQRAEAMSAIRALSTLHSAMGEGGHEAVKAATFLLERRHGFTNKERAPVEITINHDTMDVPALMEEVRVQQERLRPIALPVIDLDEE